MNKRTLYYIGLILLQLYYCTNNIVFAQNIFYQDICNCGVTGAGFSTGMGLGSGTFNVHIEPGSIIKKAILFTYSMVEPINVPIQFDNHDILFNSSDVIMNVQHKNSEASPVKLYYKDVTNLINANSQQYSVQISPSGNNINEGFWTVYLYVVYENISFPKTSYSIIINEQDLRGNEFYSVNNLNSISINYAVGFSLYTDRSAPFNVPNCEVNFNNNLLGTIGGSDNINNAWSYAGVKGHFYYQNNQLFGLDDDTPDATMNGTDGLADVSSYLTDNATSCNFQLKDIHYPTQPPNATNFNFTYFLTYTSPCNTFSVSNIPDTTICQGSSLQLYATGGQRYEWQTATPATIGLSCSDCPNPIFTSDSSMIYTVRIWDSDSCSVVRPVKIKVIPKPKNGIYTTISTQCDNETGVLKMSPVNSKKTFYAITENGDTLQTSNNSIPNISAGNYTVFYIDTNGCKSSDMTVKVDYLNNVNANFTVVPSSGSAPLNTQITNTSQNAVNYQWSVNGVSVSSALISTTTEFDTAGTYQIQLVAYGNNSECNDTITKTVFVYDSLIIQVPNVFTPNDDGINEIFTVKSNLSTQAKIQIFNRWGNEMCVFDQILKIGSNTIWNGKTISGSEAIGGVYFYTIETIDFKGKETRISGFFHLVR